MRGARRFVFVRAAFARAGRASLRFAARARAGGARRRLESASARRRRAAPGAGPRRRGFGGRFFRRRRETKTLHSEGPGGGGRGGGCRGGHQGVRHRHRARPLGPRVDQKRKRVWRRSLRVPGAQLARRARGDQPRRGALPVFASVPGAPLRGRVQTRGPVRERVAPDAGGGAALVGVRRRRARSGAGRVRGAVASVGGGVRDARRGAPVLGRRARARVVRRHVAPRRRGVPPARQRGARVIGLVLAGGAQVAPARQPRLLPLPALARGRARRCGAPRCPPGRFRFNDIPKRRVHGGVPFGVPGPPPAKRLRPGG